MMRYCILVVMSLLILPVGALAGVYVDYNLSTGSYDLPGWTYKADPGNQSGDDPNYLNVFGWAEDNGITAYSTWWGQIKTKTDYYPGYIAGPWGEISSTVTPPTGDKTLHVYERDNYSSDEGGGPGYWFSNKENLGDQGITDSTTNRMDFYMRASGLAAWNTAIPRNGTTHIGTYLCWSVGLNGNTVAPPKEASPTLPQTWIDHVATNGGDTQNGQHYYHYLSPNFDDDAWVHIQLDEHPTHARDAEGSGKPVNDPTDYLFGKPYFEYLVSWYLEIRYDTGATYPIEYWSSPFKFYTEAQAENEDSITSPWIGYYPSTGKWEVGFQDMSFYPTNSYGNYSKSKFEIRWSTSKITNASWTTANTLTPEFYRYGETNSFYRHDSWRTNAWTRFDLPDGAEDANDTIYFAIKDVSLASEGDGHDAPTSLIRTIDYSLRSGGTTSPTCSDGTQNGDETGVDCGGSCDPCSQSGGYHRISAGNTPIISGSTPIIAQ